MSSFYSPVKNRKNDITSQEYETAKKYLVSRIMNTHILWFYIYIFIAFGNAKKSIFIKYIKNTG